MGFQTLSYAKEKILQGDFDMASSYYARAKSEGIDGSLVDLHYLTRGYMVYPIEYEGATIYFEFLKRIKVLAKNDNMYLEEYRFAVQSLYDIRRLFLRALALYYYSDILVSSPDSVVLREIVEIRKYIKENRTEILENDIYGLSEFVPKYNKKKFAEDLNIIETYCLNILLSYTAEQHSVYQGKRYSALTIDYGCFYNTRVTESDRYYNYSDVKPRMFLLGLEAYYYEMSDIYKAKAAEIRNFDSPKRLKTELTKYVRHKDNKDSSGKDFIKYMRQFEKNDAHRISAFGMMRDFAKKINPLLRFDFVTDKITENNVGSFELNEYFPQKKIFGVCSMLSAGKGWNLTTVRAVMIVTSFIGGWLVYLLLAMAKKMGYYFGVTVQKP